MLQREYRQFRREPSNALWLEDAALFHAIECTPALAGKEWWDWPADLRDRDPAALAAAAQQHAATVDEFCALQFLFDRQARDGPAPDAASRALVSSPPPLLRLGAFPALHFMMALLVSLLVHIAIPSLLA